MAYERRPARDVPRRTKKRFLVVVWGDPELERTRRVIDGAMSGGGAPVLSHDWPRRLRAPFAPVPLLLDILRLPTSTKRDDVGVSVGVQLSLAPFRALQRREPRSSTLWEPGHGEFPRF